VKWFAVFFALFVLLVICLADAGRLGLFSFVNRLPYGDKAGHFLLYGILTMLVDLSLLRSLPESNPMRISIIVGFVLALLIGLEELSQRYFSSRTFSLDDLLASYLGVIFFSWAALRVNN
jgi:VanZ family protein